MTRDRKVFEELLNHRPPNLPFRDFERLLRAFGFELARTSGSHRIYLHPVVPRPFPVQSGGKGAKRYQLRQLLGLVETYGLQMEE